MFPLKEKNRDWQAIDRFIETVIQELPTPTSKKKIKWMIYRKLGLEKGYASDEDDHVVRVIFKRMRDAGYLSQHPDKIRLVIVNRPNTSKEQVTMPVTH